MISNLLVMVIVGGYETFVVAAAPRRPSRSAEWLDHVNASVLKIKLAMAIVGISSIHLLKTFIEARSLGCRCRQHLRRGVALATIIHVVFILRRSASPTWIGWGWVEAGALTLAAVATPSATGAAGRIHS